MATLALARRLNAVETIDTRRRPKHPQSQRYRYLLVLDFESTCWEKRELTSPPEIIEFSVVLYDVKQRAIVDEFQQYVVPTEFARLSEFCTKLTGISQAQVDGGVPLKTCLVQFNKWLDEIAVNRLVSFGGENATVFATWSDWDLKVCLRNECLRKNISRREYFNVWIDVRALYTAFYRRRSKGLKGALTEVGLEFRGREHSGLHDARNTAFLIGKMVADGVCLQT